MSIVDELGEFETPRVQVSGRPHVSAVGIRKINEFLYARGRPNLPEGFPKLIESRMGKMATRSQRYMQTCHGITLTPKEVEYIGNITDINIHHGKTVIYDFTYDVLRWPRGSFGNDSSCWRTTHASSIPMFEIGVGYGPGFALRVFLPDASGPWHNHTLRGYGRCWCMPLEDDALLAFNPYGDKLAVFSSILVNSLPEGKYSMRGVSAENDNEGIYVNGASATLVYPSGGKWENSGKHVGLHMPRHYTRECKQCRNRFGSKKRDMEYCDSCAVTCALTREIMGYENAAYVTDVNIKWNYRSFYVTAGYLSSGIASKTIDFCHSCMKFHGNLDDCDAGE